MGVGKESFFEIANDVVGREEYNRLIRLFRERKWSEFSVGLSEFHEMYESSPLKEALTFLEVQSLFDQDNPENEEIERKAEKKLRNALLLYPKSEFAPIMAATAGAHWLRTKNYQRSLAIYELGVSTYPGDPLYCTFLIGVAETHFQLRKWDVADEAFDVVLSQCKNFRLRAAALIRKVDANWIQGKPDVQKQYEKLLAEENPFIEHFYQPTLANLGEIMYRAGHWEVAGHYFGRYLVTEKSQKGCMDYVAKRLADIAARNGDKPGEVIGRYLLVREKYPKSDVGRFAYAHALLADPQLKGGGELERRIRLVDDEIDAFKDQDLRARVYVEKGLTMLDLEHPGALAYLNNLRGKTRFDLQKGKTGSFIRTKIVKLFEEGKLVELNTSVAERQLEAIYEDWLKGSPLDSWAPEFYSKMATNRIVAYLESEKLSEAVSLLRRWQHSPLWQKGGPHPTQRAEIINALLKTMYVAGPDSERVLAIAKAKSVIDPVLAPESTVFNWYLQALLRSPGDRTKPVSLEREISSLEKKQPPEKAPLLNLIFASGFRLSGDYAQAEARLKGLESNEWKYEIFKERLELAKAQNQGERAYHLLQRRLDKVAPEDKKSVLEQMAEVLESTKTWKLAPELIEAAKTTISEPKELSGYYHLAGRALFEIQRCKDAVVFFENGFRLNSADKRTAESKYRMGKCLLSEKKVSEAKQSFQQAAELKDSFWSPLAKSEASLISP